MRKMFGWSMGLLSSVLIAVGGCAKGRVNPSFALPVKKAKHELDMMAENPKQLSRPVIVLGGWMDPGFSSEGMANFVRKTTQNTAVIPIAFFGSSSFDDSANKLVKALEDELPSIEANETVEVDVIAYSMGGLIARYAAIPPREAPVSSTTFGTVVATTTRKRLNIRNLYTICTPHKGASLAWLGSFDPNARDMKAGSDFLMHLDQDYSMNRRFELRTYARLDDVIVGEENTAPDDVPIWWVGRAAMGGGHSWAEQDPRILADILRHMRDEPTYTQMPPAPLPD
ncbi:hypothetical protein JD969_06705 [Planctomycetota bacterium]|nr:hypothetical protein JD969_06705 [Planctomycetota bacterium]